MPVIKHFNGNCHVYVDAAADLDMAERDPDQCKCQRMGVCNAAESLLVHADVAARISAADRAALAEHGVEIRGDERTLRTRPAAKPATEEDYAAEFLGPIISVQRRRFARRSDRPHQSLRLAATPMRSSPTTCAAARRFTARVDSSAVMVNASTRFNDGGEFGLGAEIGISTDKFHARGPCGLEELTSYKYVVHGDGQIRE